MCSIHRTRETNDQGLLVTRDVYTGETFRVCADKNCNVQPQEQVVGLECYIERYVQSHRIQLRVCTANSCAVANWSSAKYPEH